MMRSRLFTTIVVWILATLSAAAEEPLPQGAVLRMGTRNLMHETWVTDVAFAPGDRQVATADYHATVRLWEVATGRLVWELPPDSGQKVAFTPDGRLIATAGYYQPTIQIWDRIGRERVRSLPQNARSLAISSDGRMLVAAGRDGIARVWNPQSGELLRELKGHRGGLYAVAISSDGKLIASGGGGDGTAPQANEVRLWDAATGELLGEFHEDDGQLEGLKGWVYNLAISSDNRYLAAATPYAVRVWDLTRRKQVQRFDKASYDVAFAPREPRLALPGHDAFGIYEPASGGLLTDLAGDVNVDGCVAFSHDGRVLVSGNRAGRVQLWDARTGKELVRRFGHQRGVSDAAFSPDGSLVVSVSREDQSVRLWGTAGGRQLRELPVQWERSGSWWNQEGTDVFFLPYGREFATWTFSGTVHFWNPGSQIPRSVKLGDESAVALRISHGGTLAAVSEYDSSLQRIGIFELDGGARRMAIDPFGDARRSDDWVSALAFSPDDRLLAVGVQHDRYSSREKKADTIQLWDLRTGQRLRSFRSWTYPPGHLVFSPDGKTLAAAATGGAPVQLWRVSDGSLIRELAVKDVGRSWYDAAPLAYSPDGKLLATATLDHRIVLWEIATGKVTREFAGHPMRVNALAFSPDGSTLLSASDDTTLLLWSVRGSEQLALQPLNVEQLERLWQDLASGDGAVAGYAAEQLVRAPSHSVAMLGERLKAVDPPDPKSIPKLVVQLQDEATAVRLKAARQLKRFGSQASPALFQALAADDATLEGRREIEAVLETIGRFPIAPETLRASRAVAVLEQIGSPEARRLLSRLAKTNPESRLASEAEHALQRLERQDRAPGTRAPVFTEDADDDFGDSKTTQPTDRP